MREKMFDLIRAWADKRGIYEHGDSKTQYLKLMEEAGELADALLKRNDDEVYDAVGDMVVVLTNIVMLYEIERAEKCDSSGTAFDKGISIEDCIQKAYDTISSRSGKMQNGTFVKDA